MRKEQLLNIYEDNGLYGAKDQNGQIVITAQYTEMYQFSCGLSLVRNINISMLTLTTIIIWLFHLVYILGANLGLFVAMPEC